MDLDQAGDVAPAGLSSGASSESVSAIPTPTNAGSENGDQTTPPTSYTSTPNASTVANGPPKLPSFQPASSLLRMEIALPDRAPPSLAPDSIKALSKSKYALSSKRKRDVFDSEEDEEEEEVEFLHVDRDAVLARRLQKEEDMRHSGLDSTPASFYSSHAGPSRRSQPFAPAWPSNTKLEHEEGIPIREIHIKALSQDADTEQEHVSTTTDSDLQAISAAPAKRRKLLNSTGAVQDSSGAPDADSDSALSIISILSDDEEDDESPASPSATLDMNRLGTRRQYQDYRNKKRVKDDRGRLEDQHPILKSMWKDLEAMPALKAGRADQPKSISRNLKPFQLEGLAWMVGMEKEKWKGGLLGDEMGLGKTIQAVSLIMSDYPAKKPTLVLVPPVALMQWVSEIDSYTDGRLKTFVYHGTNVKTKGMTVKDVKKYDVIIMSYNSLESVYRKQEKGFARKDGIYKEQSVMHQTSFHRVILDEAHCIKVWHVYFSVYFPSCFWSLSHGIFL